MLRVIRETIRIWVILTGLWVVLLLAGCAGSPQSASIPPHVTQLPEPPVVEATSPQGSLWRENGPLTNLFVDPKAANVGDIVTVSIVETSTASNDAQTQTGRKSSLTASVDGFLGLENRYASNAKFNPFSAIKGGMENAFDGSGSTARSGKLAASMTARVNEVLPNGNLRIIGSREVTVNNETQIITLSGTIRPRDISPDNVILSTYISEARITYTGDGIVHEGQRPGWFTRIMNVVWPF
ncbi:Flagellar L-ring protein [uncultured Desulfatiglans sp.]|uniref:Flagellar L-ring protein n=1 Tax=Uncultured Desulfatiglans sp. TaxID=1748965 RepID=A0A653A3A3_UNCDX|nr:Flagellar L-ring protein [uncultured Desulfatiglans sp.]